MGNGESEGLEPISYLSRSTNRVRVLEALTEEIPKPGRERPGYEPRQLREMTGASEATISRILKEFDDRGWAERTGDGEYVATPQGQHLAVQFRPFVESVETIQELEADIAMIPVTDLSTFESDQLYGLRAFSDVTIHRPGAYDQMSLGKYLGELAEDVSKHYSFGYGAPPVEYNQGLRASYEAGRLDSPVKAVYPSALVDWYGEDTVPSRAEIRTLIEDGVLVLHRYEGHMPCQFFIFDETVIIENSQATGIERGSFIETSNTTVRQWARDVFRRYQDESERIDPSDLLE